MNKYETVSISVMIDDAEEMVVITYMELCYLSKLRKDMKQIEIAPALKRAVKTIYNVSCELRKKLQVTSTKALKERVKHVDFDKLLMCIVSLQLIF